jgi:hypothetical protein
MATTMDPTADTGREEPGQDEAESLVSLPGLDTLDAILDEQATLDRLYEEDPEFAAGETGKTPVEQRYEVPALAALHHRRRELARALAPLSALFEGKAPLADAKRKQHRHAIMSLVAGEQHITGDKVESKLERLANADKRHLAFCEHLETLHVKFTLGRVALMELNEEIRDREETLRLATAEVRAGLRNDQAQGGA